jgi:50S ribosomal protein L16 3-hydroxylase
MLERMAGLLEGVRWSDAGVAEFAGRYLTEPKANVVFERPRRPLPPADFARRLRRDGVRLALASRMLFHGRRIFMNGEASTPGAAAARTAAKLADARELDPPLRLSAETRELLYAWYLAGYIVL